MPCTRRKETAKERPRPSQAACQDQSFLRHVRAWERGFFSVERMGGQGNKIETRKVRTKGATTVTTKRVYVGTFSCST